MIIENYSTFRSIANVGGPVASDGLTEFDPTLMRSGGFSGGLVLSSTSAFPIVVTCNANASDSVAGIDEYDWFVSQRTSIAADKPFTVSRKDTAPNTHSGRIELALSAWASAEYSDPFDVSAARVLWFGVDIYAIRRSDNAIQRIDMRKTLVDALSQKTDLE